MESRQLTEMGGVTLVLSALLTGVFMMLSDFGFGALMVMNVAIGFLIVGFLALWRPDLAVFTGLGAIGHAVTSFVVIFHGPVWAIPGIVGGLLTIAGGLSYEGPEIRSVDDEASA